jgi:hypothetical protein
MITQSFGVNGIAVNGGVNRPAASGAMYWDNNNNCVKIVDNFGNATSVYTSMQNVGLDGHTQEAVNWAWKKMDEERKIAALMEKHPGLKDLKEKFEVMLALVKQEV